MKLNIDKNQKLTLQFIISVVLVLAGLVLLFTGLWLPPIGEIANSVLIAYGEVSSFAGALIGIDYSYKYKIFVHGNNKPSIQDKESFEEEKQND